MGFLKIALLFSVYVSISTSFSLESGLFSGGVGGLGGLGYHSSQPHSPCTTEYDEVWEEKCETLYEDKCTVDYRFNLWLIVYVASLLYEIKLLTHFIFFLGKSAGQPVNVSVP